MHRYGWKRVGRQGRRDKPNMLGPEIGPPLEISLTRMPSLWWGSSAVQSVASLGTDSGSTAIIRRPTTVRVRHSRARCPDAEGRSIRGITHCMEADSVPRCRLQHIHHTARPTPHHSLLCGNDFGLTKASHRVLSLRRCSLEDSCMRRSLLFL